MKKLIKLQISILDKMGSAKVANFEKLGMVCSKCSGVCPVCVRSMLGVYAAETSEIRNSNESFFF